MPSKTGSGTRDTPPTEMSRSESLSSGRAPPPTKAWAITTERVPGRPARSARTRRIASVRVASWLRSGSPHGSRTASGSR